MNRTETTEKKLIGNMAVGPKDLRVDIEGGKQCRICGSHENPQSIIKPCLCDGQKRYVHRHCLDHQRVYNRAPEAFVQCTACRFKYWITKTAPTEVNQKEKRWECKKATLLITRDSIGGILAILFGLTVVAWCIAILDNGLQRIVPEDCCPQSQYNFYTWDTKNSQCPGRCGSLDATGGVLLNMLPPWIAQHTKSAYLILAFVLVWFIVASVGALKLMEMSKEERGQYIGEGCAALFCCCLCAKCCSEEDDAMRPRLNNQTYNCGGCNCAGGGGGDCSGGANCSGGGDCSGGAEGLPVLLMALVAVALAFIFLSFFMGFLIMVGLFFKMIQNHFTRIKRKELVKQFTIMDCESIQISPDEDGRGSLPPDYDDSVLREFNII